MKQFRERLEQYLPSNREVVKQQGLILFNKLIRTKNPASLQEDQIYGGLGGGGKEHGSLQVSYKHIPFHLFLRYSKSV